MTPIIPRNMTHHQGERQTEGRGCVRECICQYQHRLRGFTWKQTVRTMGLCLNTSSSCVNIAVVETKQIPVRCQVFGFATLWSPVTHFIMPTGTGFKGLEAPSAFYEELEQESNRYFFSAHIYYIMKSLEIP